MNQEKVAAVSKKSPRTKKIERYIRTSGFLQKVQTRFCKNGRATLQAIKKQNFSWSKHCESTIEPLIQELQKAPIVGFSKDTDPYTLTTGAALFGISATISQRQQWGE